MLLGSRSYDKSVDVWSCACILCELLLHRPLFPGNNDLDQLHTIFSVLGVPQRRIWPGVNDLPHIYNGVVKLKQEEQSFGLFNNLKLLFPGISEDGFELMLQLLAYDPHKRLTAEEASRHPYFFSSPMPCNESMMPNYFHENLSCKNFFP